MTLVRTLAILICTSYITKHLVFALVQIGVLVVIWISFLLRLFTNHNSPHTWKQILNTAHVSLPCRIFTETDGMWLGEAPKACVCFVQAIKLACWRVSVKRAFLSLSSAWSQRRQHRRRVMWGSWGVNLSDLLSSGPGHSFPSQREMCVSGGVCVYPARICEVRNETIRLEEEE